MQTPPSYRSLLETSQRVNWRVDDIIGGRKRLDFSKPFLPEAFAGVAKLSFLAAHERLALNHIRAHCYLAMFELVETFILPFISAQAGPGGADESDRAVAFANFAMEEAKHIALFQRFKTEFAEGFGLPCPIIGPADAISKAILAHSPLSVAILVLGIEWMSQGHYLESVKDDAGLDPQFKSLLKHHWIEEVQHAKLDGLLVRDMAKACAPEAVERAIGEYLEMIGFLDAGLKKQIELDLGVFETCLGRTLSEPQRDAFRRHQLQALRWTMLGTAMRNENFLGVLGELGASARARVEEAGKAFQPA
jgi:hypothetical protein